MYDIIKYGSVGICAIVIVYAVIIEVKKKKSK